MNNYIITNVSIKYHSKHLHQQESRHVSLLNISVSVIESLTREDYDRTWVFYNLDINWNASLSDRMPYQSKTLLGISFIFSHKMYNIWFCIICPFLILTFLGDIWFSLYLVGAICTLSLIYNHLSRSAFHIHSLIPFTFSPLFVPRPVIHFLLSLAQHGIVPHGPHVGPPA